MALLNHLPPSGDKPAPAPKPSPAPAGAPSTQPAPPTVVVLPPSNPAPQPAPPAKKSYESWLVGGALIVAALFVYDHRELLNRRNVTPEPAPGTIAAAAREYDRTLPDALNSTGEKIKAGKLKTKADIVKALSAHSKPFVDALDSAFAPAIDDKGSITDANTAAKALLDAATALRAGQ